MNLPPAPRRPPLRTTAQTSGNGPLQRVRLRWLICGITAAMMLCFMAIALLDHRVAAVALAGAVVVALNGLTWLLILRRTRARLRRHGYRW
jgi:hypothetical protein